MLPAGPIDGAVGIEIVIDGTIHTYQGPETDWPLDRNGGALSLINFQNAQNLVIRGSGLVDGHGYKWWWKTILTAKDNRPVLLTIGSSVDFSLEGVTFKNSPKYHIEILDVLRCTVQDLAIHVDITDEKGLLAWIPTFPLNTDGIDISGRDIYFRNLTIECFDDAVAVKPLHVGKGVYSNCTENLLIEDSYVKYGVGMSIGSVPPNDDLNCIRNVTFNNIKFDYPLKAIYIKPNPGTHGAGLIQQITYQNIEIS
jgi:polygalacturonase